MLNIKSVYGFRLVISVITIVFLLPTILFAFQNEPVGFRGIRWGTHIEELLDMVPAYGIKTDIEENVADCKFYTKKNDNMKIGDSDINKIAYGFYKGRFYNVRIFVNNLENYSSIKQTIFQLYGNADRKVTGFEIYSWFGSNVDVRLSYSDLFGEGSAKVDYTYKPINEEMRVNSIKGSGDF